MKKIVGREFFFRIDEMKIARAGAIRLVGESGRLFRLTDIDGHGDDIAAVVFLQPRNDDRGVESARIGECYFFDGLLHRVSVLSGAPAPRRRFRLRAGEGAGAALSYAAFSLVSGAPALAGNSPPAEAGAPSTSSSALMNSVNAFFGVTYGGKRRITFVRAVPTTNPFASSSFCTGAAARSSSMPHMNPEPRTSTIDACFSLSCANSRASQSPYAAMRLTSALRLISSSTMTPRRQAIGLPPKVVP